MIHFHLLRRITCIGLIGVVTAHAAPRWLSFEEDVRGEAVAETEGPASKDASVSVEDHGLQGVSMTCRIPGTFVNTRTKEHGEFDYLSIPGFGVYGRPGVPAVPQRTFFVMLPSRGEPVISITDTRSRRVSGYRVAPAQPPEPEEEGERAAAFAYDAAAYTSSQAFPEDIVVCTDIRTLRGIRYACIQVRPVQTFPASNTLRVYSHISFSIDFSQGQQPYAHRPAPMHMRMLKNTIINDPAPFFEEPEQQGGAGFPGMLIVTIDQMRAAADTLAHWKRLMGYDVYICAPAQWTDAAMVQDTIHTYAASQHIDFFVIIGDIDHVPAQSGYRMDPGEKVHATDLPYACLDGEDDWIPDLGYGRMPVNGAAQALTVVHKTVNYERDPVDNSAFYRTIQSIAYFQDKDDSDDPCDGIADRRFAQTSLEAAEYLKSQGYIAKKSFCREDDCIPQYWNNEYYSTGEAIPDSMQYPAYPWDATPADVKQAINEGRFFVFYRDHGKEYRWSHPRFDTDSIANLSNGRLQPVVYSLCCKSGMFDYEDVSFCEAFLRKHNGGAVGIVGATHTAYSGYNDGLGLGMIDAIWADPGLVPDFNEPSPAQQAHAPIYHMGLVVNFGKLRMSSTFCEAMGWDNSEEYTYSTTHYFGDPSMRIWTDEPQDMECAYGVREEGGANVLDITDATVDSGMVTLWSEGDSLHRAYLHNGDATMQLASSMAGQDSALLTITAHNFRPFMQWINLYPTGITRGVDAESGPTRYGMRVAGLDNGNARIRFAVPLQFTGDGAVPISIRLFQVNGTLVATLLEKHMPSGYHTVSLPAGELAHGVYMCRMRAPGFDGMHTFVVQ